MNNTGPIELLLGIDCGGSHTCCLAVNIEADRLQYGHSGPSNPLSVGAEAAKAAVDQAVEGALRGWNVPVHRIAVQVGSADEELTPAAPHLQNLQRFSQVFVSSDVYCAWAGAGLLQPGTSVVAGTGSIGLVVQPDGTCLRRGGWGPLLGDEGSGYALGIHALRALLQDWEEGNGMGPFSKALMSHLGLTTCDDLWPWVYAVPFPRDEIAALSSFVDGQASQGDDTARALLECTAEELAGLSIRCLDAAAVKTLWCLGGVFRSAVVAESFAPKVRQAVPKADIQRPQSPPEAGAAMLAYRRCGGSDIAGFCRRLIQQLEGRR